MPAIADETKARLTVEKLNELLTKSNVFFNHGVSIGLGTKKYDLKILTR